MKSELAQAIKQLCDEKNLPLEAVIETIESALAAAYRKDYGEKNQNIRVTFDPETGATEAFDVKEVVEDEFVAESLARAAAALSAAQGTLSVPAQAPGQSLSGATTIAPSLGTTTPPLQESQQEEERRYNPKTMIALSEAVKLKPGSQVGDELRMPLPAPAGYGRMAAQTAKQVIIQKIREAERAQVYQEFKSKEGELMTGVVQRVEGRVVFIDLGKMTAVLPPSEQQGGESPRLGERLKVYVKEVKETARGPEVVVSRAHPEIVRQLFRLEVPEVAAGTVELKSVAREAGSRTKVAVAATDPNIDPIGSCVGQKGTRVQTIINELGGEKVDIIEYSADPVHYILNALSPAKVSRVELDEGRTEARAYVREDQLSLAIGKGGQNVRLAGKLTGWRIDVLQEGLEEGVQAVVTSASESEVRPGAQAVPVQDGDGSQEAEESQ